MVEADPKQMKHVFWNLFMNAVQAMSQGGSLKVEIRNTGSSPGILQSADNPVEIIVTDTGCGIPEENQDMIFDPFFTTKDRGTGMGLAIAYRIIESCRGRMIVRNKIEQGTSFFVYLPVVSF